MSDGAWIVGLAFISELDNAELRLFQAERIKPAIADGRRWVRFPCNVETLCYTCETIPGERRKVQILNISAGGIGPLLPCEFSAGTVLRLELPADMTQPARLLLVRVIHCVEMAGRGWMLGCEFADQLGTEELDSISERRRDLAIGPIPLHQSPPHRVIHQPTTPKHPQPERSNRGRQMFQRVAADEAVRGIHFAIEKLEQLGKQVPGEDGE